MGVTTVLLTVSSSARYTTTLISAVVFPLIYHRIFQIFRLKHDHLCAAIYPTFVVCTSIKVINPQSILFCKIVSYSPFLDTFNIFRPTRKLDWMDIESYSSDNTVSCPDCLPLCSHSIYRIETTYSRIVTRSFRRKAWGIM